MKTLGHLSLSVLLAIVFMAAFPFMGHAGEPETASCSYVDVDGTDAINVSWVPVTGAHKYKIVIWCVDDVEGVTAYVGFTTGDCDLFLDSEDGDCDQTDASVTVSYDTVGAGEDDTCTAHVRTIKKGKGNNNGQGKNSDDPWSEDTICEDSGGGGDDGGSCPDSCITIRGCVCECCMS